jgi:hypothetical protein
MRTSNLILVVANRRNNRLQRFTLDGRHVDFIQGLRLICHFYEYKGDVAAPDPDGRVTLMDKDSQIIGELGDSHEADNQLPLRTQTRDKFVPESLFARTSLVMTTKGIFSLVKFGGSRRVTKLRKV